MTDLDPHGQPFNLRFNRARRAERDLSELLGLAKGLLADGVINEVEATAVGHWLLSHSDAVEQWPVNLLAKRMERIYRDGRIEEDERDELARMLESIVGGTAGVVLGEDAATELPIDVPPPVLTWSGSIFVFTGKFAFGTRACCEREVKKHGGKCEATVTGDTTYVVIGTFGSRDWIHTSFGRKIQKAVEIRRVGRKLAIVGEDHWARCLPGQW